jgi:hypothetical protein
MRSLKLILLMVLWVQTSCKETEKSQPKQVKVNVDLKEKLNSILLKDQGIREVVNGNLTDSRKAVLLNDLNLKEVDIKGDNKFSLMRKIDSINIIEIEKIISEYGYPSKSLVGEPANKAVFYVIQHSDKIEQYLPIIRKAAENNDISKTSLARMEDRNLMHKGIEQIYGTQIKGQANKDGDWVYFLWPIKNADSINIWRKQIGFTKSIEEYVQDMDIEYKLYKIEELKDL